MLFRFSNWLCGFRQTSHPRWEVHKDGNVSLRSLSLRLVEFVKRSSALCNMLVFSGAALPSLHFHEKDPGSAQFLWSQLCKQVPGSTLIGAPVSPLPPPGIHQDSLCPDCTLLQARCAGGRAVAVSHTQPPFTGQL